MMFLDEAIDVFECILYCNDKNKACIDFCSDCPYYVSTADMLAAMETVVDKYHEEV